MLINVFLDFLFEGKTHSEFTSFWVEMLWNMYYFDLFLKKIKPFLFSEKRGVSSRVSGDSQLFGTFWDTPFSNLLADDVVLPFFVSGGLETALITGSHPHYIVVMFVSRQIFPFISSYFIIRCCFVVVVLVIWNWLEHGIRRDPTFFPWYRAISFQVPNWDLHPFHDRSSCVCFTAHFISHVTMFFSHFLYQRSASSSFFLGQYKDWSLFPHPLIEVFINGRRRGLGRGAGEEGPGCRASHEAAHGHRGERLGWRVGGTSIAGSFLLGKNPFKWMIWGQPYFRKPPNGGVSPCHISNSGVVWQE